MAELKQELWTVREVAAYIRKSEQTVRNKCRSNQIPFKKVVNTIYFDPDVIKKIFKP